MPGHLVGTCAAAGLGGARQHLLQARRFQQRDGVLAQDLVGGRGGVDAVGEHIGVGRVRGDQAGRVAGRQRERRVAGGAGDVAETVSARVGNHFLQDVEGIDRDHPQAGRLQAVEQCGVVGGGSGRALRHGGGTAGAEARGDAHIRNGRHHQITCASGLQRANRAHLRGHGAADDGLRLGRRGGCSEQVIGAAPHGVQRIRVGLTTVGRQIGIDLAGHRRCCAELADRTGLDARAAGSIVVAGLAIAVGRRIGAEVVAHVFGPHPARVGGELAGDRARGGRQQRVVVTAVGEAVTEEHGLIEGRVGHGRAGRQRDGHGHQGTDRAKG